MKCRQLGWSPLSEEHAIPNKYTRREKLQLFFVGLFVFVNVLVPLLIDDLYPFTSAPMFRDQPRRYCNYEVYGPNGERIPNEDFLLQRVYDGNPPGIGVGIKPPAVLEKQFGDVADQDQVTRHVREQLVRYPNLAHVTVVQKVVSPDDNGRLVVEEAGRWQVTRDTDAP